MRLAKLAGMILVSFFAAVGVQAQTSTGEVNGTVTDKTGSAISGAAVRLTNQGTRTTSEAQTNGNGYFLFINVQPGSYVLTIEKQGFKTAQVSGFDIQVNQTLTQNISLEVGQVNQSITVSAEAPLLQSSTSELGTVISETPLKELPLNGRNFTQLLILTPGITPISTAQGSGISATDAGITAIPGTSFYKPAVNGQENCENLFYLDGILNTDIRGAVYGVLPILDTLNEFKVQSQNDKAEFGGTLRSTKTAASPTIPVTRMRGRSNGTWTWSGNSATT